MPASKDFQGEKRSEYLRYSVVSETFASLAFRDFRLLWIAVLFMMAMLPLMSLAQGFLAYKLTGSAKVLALVHTGGALSLLVLAPLGGVVADRFEKKRILQLVQIIFVVLSVLIAVIIILDKINWTILVLGGVAQGSAWAFAAPARQSLVSMVVPKEMMGNAIILAGFAASASHLVFPLVAGSIYATLGPQAVFFVVSIMAFGALIFTTMLSEIPRDISQVKPRIIEDLKQGFTFIIRHKILRILLLSHVIITFLSSPLQMLMPAVVVDVYNRDSDSLGLMLSLSGAGSLFGALFMAAIGSGRRGVIFLIAGICTGVTTLVVGISGSFSVASIFMLVLGFGNVGMWSLSQALGMGNTDEEYRGRVMSVFMMSWGISSISTMPVGYMADIFGSQFILAILGIILIGAVIFIGATQKSLRQLE